MDISNLYPQVLQKLGKTVETKDERFEQSANNFYHQQVMGGGSRDGTWRKKEDMRAEWQRNSRFFKPAGIPTNLSSSRGKGHYLSFFWNQRNLLFLFLLTPGSREETSVVFS